MRRSLSLQRETLADLTSDELGSVAGGSHACAVTHGPSIDETCFSLPVTDCWRPIYETLFTSACG
jgi:hypothetical protein